MTARNTIKASRRWDRKRLLLWSKVCVVAGAGLSAGSAAALVVLHL